jgi:hypothetical protein
MTAVHATTGVLVLVLNAAAAAWGGWCWWQVVPSRAFWPLLRAAQAAAALAALLGGIVAVTGDDVDDLHLLYGVLPIPVAFFAEQIRLTSVHTVLAGRGLSSSREVARLPEEEQQSIVLATIRREIGVMAASAGVILFLAVRAAQEAGWF